jgi:hypothetical protein
VCRFAPVCHRSCRSDEGRSIPPRTPNY